MRVEHCVANGYHPCTPIHCKPEQILSLSPLQSQWCMHVVEIVFLMMREQVTMCVCYTVLTLVCVNINMCDTVLTLMCVTLC